jgi:hypothetical protein
MAANVRVVVTMTAVQKAEIARRARVEGLRVGEYMRRRALDGDPTFDGLLSELRRAAAGAREGCELLLARLEGAQAGQGAADEQARQQALREFEDLDADALVRHLAWVGEEAAGAAGQIGKPS